MSKPNGNGQKLHYEVELVISCPKHGQVSADHRLLTEESQRLVIRWLEECECPYGKYRISILKRQDGRKLRGKTCGFFRLDLKRNTLQMLVAFTNNSNDCRRVELIMPEGVKAEQVHYLVAGKAATLEYVSGPARHISAVFDMIYYALRISLCTGHYFLQVEEINREQGVEGIVLITGYRIGRIMLCVQPVGKPAYDVTLIALQPVPTATKMISAGQAFDDWKVEKQRKLEMLDAHEGEKAEEEKRELTRRVGYFACYGLFLREEFPEIPEPVAKQVYNQACREHNERPVWNTFKSQYLEPFGFKCWVPQGFIYELLLKAVATDVSTETHPEWRSACQRVKGVYEELERSAESRRQAELSYQAAVLVLREKVEKLREQLDLGDAELREMETARPKWEDNEVERHGRMTTFMEGPFGELVALLGQSNTRSE